MKYHIVCLGDSNTHGLCADPKDTADGGNRFNEEERWTKRLQTGLGDKYLVLEEGLNGRTTCFEDPVLEGRCALSYITPCLLSHAPVDLLIIMLGTNDTKDRFGTNAGCIGLGMERLLTKAVQTACWRGAPNILIIAPPHIREEIYQGVGPGTLGYNCVEKSRDIFKYYKQYCSRPGVSFLDAQALGCEINGIDFVHMTKNGHATLANHLISLVPELLK